MIKLHQFKKTWDISNLSHFCLKIETYLRMANLPYEVIETLPLLAPRGKLPYITDEGKKISDSRLILNYLESQYKTDLDQHLSAEEKAIARAFQRLLEEHFYWINMYTRWSYSPEGWQTNKQAIFGGLPPVARDLVAAAYRLRIKGQMHGQGTGRLSTEEIFALGREDIDALADFLGDKTYFMGDRPSTIDASAFGMLANTVLCPVESPLKAYAQTKSNIVRYCTHMQATYFDK